MLLYVANLEEKHIINLIVAGFQHKKFMVFPFSIANYSKHHVYVWYFYKYG